MKPKSSESNRDGLTPFPERLGAVFVKELRQGLRAHQFVWPFVSLQVVAIFVVVVEYFTVGVGGGDPSDGIFGLFTSGGLFFGLLSTIFCGLMPLTLFNSLQPELGGGRNVELLLMSNLTRWQIVRGKWLVGSVLSALMLVSLVPYALTRYFVGGVDLPTNLFMIVMILIGNSVMNGVVIGASGFRNYLVRVVLIGVCAGSGFLTAGMCLVPAFAMMGSSSSSMGLLSMLLLVVLSGVGGALYIAFGLQLGRAQLRLFENPIDPPSSGLIIALIIFTPIIVGVTLMATGGMGGVVGAGGLLALVLLIDRGPGKNQDIRYAQA